MYNAGTVPVQVQVARLLARIVVFCAQAGAVQVPCLCPYRYYTGTVFISSYSKMRRCLAKFLKFPRKRQNFNRALRKNGWELGARIEAGFLAR